MGGEVGVGVGDGVAVRAGVAVGAGVRVGVAVGVADGCAGWSEARCRSDRRRGRGGCGLATGGGCGASGKAQHHGFVERSIAGGQHSSRHRPGHQATGYPR